MIDIGIAYREGNNYKEKARTFIPAHYAFDIGDVLFKPTYTSDVVFRNNPKAALSYFVSGEISEDAGFAVKPWGNINASELNFLIEDNLCAVMGIRILKPLNSEAETKIAFTFTLVRSNENLKIKIHHSSELN